MPSADFCNAMGRSHGRLQSDMDTLQISRGKTSILPHNPLDLQHQVAVDMDFALFCTLIHLKLPCIQFLFVGSRFRYRFLQTPPRDDALASCLHFTSTRLCGGLAPPRHWACPAHRKVVQDKQVLTLAS